MHEIPLPHGIMTRFPAVGVNKNALILCPGGGYEHCSIREGAPAGRAFAKSGVEAFVLRYDCAPAPLGTRPLAALSAAVQWVRAHAEQYGISPQRIAVGGFSAGAHLAGLHAAVSAGKYAHRGSFEQLAGDDMEKQQAFSLETLVSPDMPRTFLWHTLTDETVPVENSLLLEKSLRRAGVSHEMHLFPHGVHGLALADMETSDIEKGRLPDRHIARWQALCAEWLKE